MKISPTNIKISDGGRYNCLLHYSINPTRYQVRSSTVGSLIPSILTNPAHPPVRRNERLPKADAVRITLKLIPTSSLQSRPPPLPPPPDLMKPSLAWNCIFWLWVSVKLASLCPKNQWLISFDLKMLRPRLCLLITFSLPVRSFELKPTFYIIWCCYLPCFDTFLPS